MSNGGLGWALWQTYLTMRSSWRKGCKLRHIWGRAHELEAKLGHPDDGIKQCQRCGAIRGV